MLAAIGTALAGAAVAVSGTIGALPLTGVAAVLVVLAAAGWPGLIGVGASRVASSVVIAVSGLAAVLLARWSADRVQPLGAFAVLLAGCVLLAFAHQLLRRGGRANLSESLAATVSGQVIAVLCAGWLLLPGTRLGVPSLVVAAVAVIVAALVAAAPLDAAWRGIAAFVVGSAAGVVAAVVGADADLGPTVVVAIAVAGVGAGTCILVQAQDAARRGFGLLAAAAGPVCAVGTVAYAVARLAGG